MSRIAFLSLRALQLALSIASIGLSAYVVNDYNQRSRNSAPSPFTYLMVSSIFSIISVAYLSLTPLFVPRIYHQYAAVVVESVNAALYFAGFIAIAVFIGSLIMCEGTVCSCARADAVVAAGQFTVWITTTAFTAKDLFKKAFQEPKKDGEGREMGQA
ncbi:MARVEL-like domain-containing protein [Fusarium globosum]|uniref:MARVEL-like domain-containing protein n=1 Tax=Fusarium globosum TaxID=78864 RepID=A0A8H5XYL7_9HYPO|nr:MARVEL-like domain-containing protein [Fusarium globosum]